MQTREDRIFRHYTKLRRHGTCCAKHKKPLAEQVWMPLARHWGMPIVQIKKIIEAEKERRRAEVQDPR